MTSFSQQNMINTKTLPQLEEPACEVHQSMPSIRQSELFSRTRRTIAKEEVSINAQLLGRAGFIEKLMAGVYSFLPLGTRVLSNIERIVREEMFKLGAHEVLLPAMHPRDIWDQTGRWDKVDVLFKLKGAGDRDIALGPTHEEVITPLVGSFIESFRDLPRAVFQIQTKFRNEPRAKSGILRGREFRMKDLYSFHASQADLDQYYEGAIKAYKRIFSRCGLGGDLTFLTFASGGAFSRYSHEFQTLTPNGEDVIFVDRSKGVAVNKEIFEEIKHDPAWVGSEFEEAKAIEVGNIFKLGTRFTEAFGVKYQDQAGEQQPVVMGCYGIGTTRLIGAIVEVHHDEKGIIWPSEVAPFNVHLVSLCRTPEQQATAETIYRKLQMAGISVLFDDRTVSAGEKLVDSDLIGIPLRVVVSGRTLEKSSAELKCRNEVSANILPLDSLLTTIKEAAKN